MKKIYGWTAEPNLDLALGYVQQNCTSFYQEVDIWSNKRRVDMQILAEGDRPAHQLRWSEQFFMDEAGMQEFHKLNRCGCGSPASVMGRSVPACEALPGNNR